MHREAAYIVLTEFSRFKSCHLSFFGVTCGAW